MVRERACANRPPPPPTRNLRTCSALHLRLAARSSGSDRVTQAMVRTKSGEQAKRLAAKLAAAADTPPPSKPAKSKPSNLHFLGDPRPTGNPPAEESAEDVSVNRTGVTLFG